MEMHPLLLAERSSRTGRRRGPARRPGARRPPGRRRTNDAGGRCGAGAAAPSGQGGPGGAAGAGISEVMVVEGGRVAGQTTPEARAQGRPDRRRSLGRLAAVRLLGDAREAAAAAAVSDRPGQRAVSLGQELRAPARGPVLRGVRDVPEPEPDAATAGGQEAPRLPRPGEGRGARGAVGQERDPAGGAGEGPEPRPRDGRRDAHDHDRARQSRRGR